MKFKYYENSNGGKIDFNELDNFKDYCKVFVSEETSKIKMKEQYCNSKFHRLKYYMDPDENEQEVAKILSKTKNKFFIVYKSIRGTNTIENLVSYSDLKTTSKSTQLYNNYGQIICSQPIHLITGKPDYNKTEKYLFNPNDTEKYPCEEYIFEYTWDGKLESIRHVSNNYWKGWNFLDFETVNKWFNHTLNYYLTAEF